MRAAFIANGIVINIVEVKQLAAMAGLVACPNNNIGDKYDAETGTFELTDSEYKAVIQNVLDDTAKQHGYDNIITACSYSSEPAVQSYQVEGQAFMTWRAAVLAYATSAIIAKPSIDVLISNLPVLDLTSQA
jgi:hypothetical protein